MGSLLKSIGTGVILAIVSVMVLAQLGVNIAPIIASAGIVGIALGFGAQNLVKDLLSGIFMILEDQYGVGDAVDLGEASGTVEAVGLRVTRLRDVNGTVWYVRNGEILRVGNQSQNWARTVLDITVDYEANLDQVQRVLEEEATAMYEDERFHDVIIEQPEVWGVERFDKDGAVVRVVLKTAPLQQWLVARAMRQRVKARFDQEGIRIPTTFRTTTDEEPPAVTETQTFYDAIGGHDTIKLIVDTFYEGVATDEVLRPLYPEEDLGPAAHRFTMFLEQYWGGPTTYSDQRGHPRLRMRHAPFAVTPEARDRWLVHFREGLDKAKPLPRARRAVLGVRPARGQLHGQHRSERAKDCTQPEMTGIRGPRGQAWLSSISMSGSPSWTICPTSTRTLLTKPDASA